MRTYTTSEVANIIGVHSNTVRMYEEWGMLPIIERKRNGYRIFTEFHIAQLKLVRIGLQIEVLQNGLRKKVIKAMKCSAQKDFDRSLVLIGEYQIQIQQELSNAEEAICIAKKILAGISEKNTICMTRKEVLSELGISMDTLRNWERNGLLSVKKKQNGYCFYTNEDLECLKMIRSLRCANYSLEAILRLLNARKQNSKVNMKQALNVPEKDTDMISVCDRLILSLKKAGENAEKMKALISDMKRKYS